MRATLLALLSLLACACTPGPYPLDVFSEMHYTSSQRRLEPRRLAPGPDAVPLRGARPALAFDRAAGRQDPLQPDDAVLARARQLYEVNCAMCHGADGTGGRARDNLPAIPDFTADSWHKRRSDPQLVVSILDGKGVEMPAFRDKVTREQARDLVAFIRAFAPGTTQPAGAASDDFEGRFRQLREEFEGLRRQRESGSSPSFQLKSKGAPPPRSTGSSPTGSPP